MAPVLHSSLATATSLSMIDAAVPAAFTGSHATTLPRPPSARRNPAGSGFEWPSAAYNSRRVDRAAAHVQYVRSLDFDDASNPPASLAIPHVPPETNPTPRNAAQWPTSARRNATRASRIASSLLNQTGSPAATAAEAAQLYYQQQQQTTTAIGYIPVRELPPGASSLRPAPVPAPAVPDTLVAHLHPQFRSKPVCDLSCRHCTRTIGQRGMKAILLADTKVELYSTDAPLVGAIQLVHDEYMTENCQCKINDVACLGCGNCIGYSVVAPCTSCLAACNNGHFYMFHSDGVKAMERVRDGSVLMWGLLAPAHLDRTCVAGVDAAAQAEEDDQDDDDEDMKDDDEGNYVSAPHPCGAAEAAEPATSVQVHDDDDDWIMTCR